jgi:hypothetical protein
MGLVNNSVLAYSVWRHTPSQLTTSSTLYLVVMAVCDMLANSGYILLLGVFAIIDAFRYDYIALFLHRYVDKFEFECPLR